MVSSRTAASEGGAEEAVREVRGGRGRRGSIAQEPSRREAGIEGRQRPRRKAGGQCGAGGDAGEAARQTDRRPRWQWRQSARCYVPPQRKAGDEVLPANTEGRRQYALPLLLQLWDVPLDEMTDGNADEDSSGVVAANCESAREIAGMFRFAQHVTLCPDPAGGADLDDLSCDLASLIDETAPNGVHRSNSESSSDGGTEHDLAVDSAVDLSLGHALQCALNLAAAETADCRLPVFGVWRRDGSSLSEQHQDGHEEFHDTTAWITVTGGSSTPRR